MTQTSDVPEQEEVVSLRDRLLRLAADFDNWKKHAQKELTEAEARGRADVFTELIPVLDNVARALAQIKREDPIAKGVELVYQQLLGVAEKVGVRQLVPLGEPFDPRVHEAVAELATIEMPTGTVAQVHAPGYLLGDRVLRPARVAVSREPSQPLRAE
jgi:molecular chaperone GrpE